MHGTSVLISAGAGHTVCLLLDRKYTPERKTTTLYTWGQGEDGQLGHGVNEDLHLPMEVDALKNIQLATVCCGANHTVAVTAEPKREFYAWGWGDFGRLGQGDPGDRCVPSPVTALSGISIRNVACGDSHCLVVANDGKLFSFGRNQNGQLGLGDTEDRLKPSLVETLWEDGILVRKSAGGAEHSAITVEGGTMYTFGWGRYGNLGHGHCLDLHVPTKVQGLAGETVTDPVCGWRHSAALTSGGRLWTFGWSKYGQLGHGDNVDLWLPKILPEFEGGGITSAAGGWRHMCALAGSTGTLYSWGWNQFGQLGVGSTEDANSPQRVRVGSENLAVSAMACGWRHTLAVAGEDSDVFSWGRCTNGQLGHGKVVQRNLPTKVAALNSLRQGLSLVLDSDHVATKRTLEENKDLEVPTSNKKQQLGRDCTAVPE